MPGNNPTANNLCHFKNIIATVLSFMFLKLTDYKTDV